MVILIMCLLFFLLNAIVILSFPIAFLLQLCFDNSFLQESWHQAYVTPVFKEGESSMVGNYRLISLTCRINSFFSFGREVLTEIPQDSILRPLLYIIFIYNLVDNCNNVIMDLTFFCMLTMLSCADIVHVIMMGYLLQKDLLVIQV